MPQNCRYDAKICEGKFGLVCEMLAADVMNYERFLAKVELGSRVRGEDKVSPVLTLR